MALADAQAFLDPQPGESSVGYIDADDIKNMIAQTYNDLDHTQDGDVIPVLTGDIAGNELLGSIVECLVSLGLATDNTHDSSLG